jgi:DUF1680 family protein
MWRYVLAFALLASGAYADTGVFPLRLTVFPEAHYKFGGALGERLDANVENWILPAPEANPGMLDMFRMRDRKPVPQLVPWAGEFVGKYLISAVMAAKASDNPVLRDRVAAFVQTFITTQSPEGYLGPFPKDRRLLGDWDLWGHYHAILGLLDWHALTGDVAALDCAKRAADFICSVYLNMGRRPIEAGSDEMNLAIVHGLARLYRETGEQRYLDMARVAEADWEKGGDYLRQGLADVPFYKTPRPRWESLHDLQGLTELYRITGEEKYRTALVNLWRSIRDHDRHNTGGFTTGEQAIGEPYTEGAIETCCTTAWSALCQDVLMLTGDAEAADELELSLYNSIMGSQHPSGRWCTYNTPMNGKREASAHTIVFQARAGTPELNCCSVNGPRGLAMPVEWALMQSGDLFINYLGPMQAELETDGVKWSVKIESDYPKEGVIDITLRYEVDDSRDEFLRYERVYLRIPKWLKLYTITDVDQYNYYSNGLSQYMELPNPIEAGRKKHVRIHLPIVQHHWIGDGEQLGKISLYAGPLLLAFDQRDNTMDCEDLGELDFTNMALERTEIESEVPPMVAYRTKTAEGQEIILRDFATAGANGTEYRSWLPVRNVPPPAFKLESPAYKAHVPAQGVVFQWQGSRRPDGWSYVLEVDEGIATFEAPILSVSTQDPQFYWDTPLDHGKAYFWRVRTINPSGETFSDGDYWEFEADNTLPEITPAQLSLYMHRGDGLIAGDALDGAAAPEYGVADTARLLSPTPGRTGTASGAVHLDATGMARYKTAGFPSRDYTVAFWTKLDALPEGRIGQLFSAWCKGGDDPLRVVVDGGKVYAKLEGMGGGSTQGADMPVGVWTHVAAVKQGNSLKLYLNGEAVATGPAPMIVVSAAKDVALGNNPHHSADESVSAAFDDFALHARAFTIDEVQALAK